MHRQFTHLVFQLGPVVMLAAMLVGCTAEKVEQPTVATPASNETKTTSTEASPSAEGTKMKAKLIPRDVLFGNPQRAQARLSPSG